MKFKIAIIGFGTVGQGLVEILLSKKEFLKQTENFEWSLVAVSDFKKGSVLCNEGLNAQELLSLTDNSVPLENYTGDGIKGLTPEETIHRSNADIVVETTYTNIETAEPATSFVRLALSLGKHVVSSNKGPAALHYNELQQLAREHGVQYLIEGTVLSGTPVIDFVKEELAGNEIKSVKGIFNGTTNFILCEMEKGKSYDEALRKAQKLGYAEADPTADVEGFDVAAKVAILANILMNKSLNPLKIPRRGITHITPQHLTDALKKNKRWKLIGEITNNDGEIVASVSPQEIDADSPLGSTNGATNAIVFQTDLLGEVTIFGPGAGKKETGFAILSDILRINKLTKNKFPES